MATAPPYRLPVLCSQVVRAAVFWQCECAHLQYAPWEGQDELYYLSQAELGTF